MNCEVPRVRPDRRDRATVSSSRLAALALAGACAGCVPIIAHRYYEPSASEGATPRNRCWKTFETIVIRRDAIQFTTKIVPYGDARHVEIAVAIPAGHRVSLDGKAIAVFDAEGNRHPSMTIAGVGLIQSPAARARDIRTTMVGETLVGETSRNFWLYAPFDADGLERFSLVLPTFVIDGAPTELPPIDFKRTRRWQFLAPLQC